MEATEQPVLSADVVAVADNVTQLMRSFARTRARVLDAAAHDVEWTAQMVLKCLANEGPMRSSAIAEHVRADPSTVSRQVAALVKEGLVERTADPERRDPDCAHRPSAGDGAANDATRNTRRPADAGSRQPAASRARPRSGSARGVRTRRPATARVPKPANELGSA